MKQIIITTIIVSLLWSCNQQVNQEVLDENTNNTENKSLIENQPEEEDVSIVKDEPVEEKNKINYTEKYNFIPNDYEIVISGNELNVVNADLNKDGIMDYAVLITNGKNNGNYIGTEDIRLSIFEGQENGSYKLKNQTGNLDPSFVYYNKSKKINLSNENVIGIQHVSMRHDYELKFRYEKKHEDYMLIGSEYTNYNYNSGNYSTNFLSGKRIIEKEEEGNTTIDIKINLKSMSEVNYDNIYQLITE